MAVKGLTLSPCNSVIRTQYLYLKGMNSKTNMYQQRQINAADEQRLMIVTDIDVDVVGGTTASTHWHDPLTVEPAANAERVTACSSAEVLNKQMFCSNKSFYEQMIMAPRPPTSSRILFVICTIKNLQPPADALPVTQTAVSKHQRKHNWEMQQQQTHKHLITLLLRTRLLAGFMYKWQTWENLKRVTRSGDYYQRQYSNMKGGPQVDRPTSCTNRFHIFSFFSLLFLFGACNGLSWLPISFLWSPYVTGQTIIFSCCGLFFLLSFFFPLLISAVGDWMFTILWHMVWP